MKRSVRIGLLAFPALLFSLLFTDLRWMIIYPVIIASLSLMKVTYGALSFNDCKKDAEYLKKEIIEAKTDLAKRGFRFVT